MSGVIDNSFLPPADKKHRIDVESIEKRNPEVTWMSHQHVKEMELKRKRYVVFSAEAFDSLADQIQNSNPDRFVHFPINWHKFPDGTDDITINGFTPRNRIAGEHILFLASFHNNDVTLSQFSVMIVLLQSFIESLTIVLPFYPVGTMDRVDVEGKIATANTYALLLSNLPNLGKPNRIMIYDIHALQIRFYFHNATIPSLHTTLPLLLQRLQTTNIKTVAFPDAGAAKRFGEFFNLHGFDIIICGKVRDGLKRKIYIQEGVTKDQNIVIVDDLVQTGGTLYECGVALKAAGALLISAYVAHAVFPNNCWTDFLKGNKKVIFDQFWLTNSQPTIIQQLPKNDAFEVLDLAPQILSDLDAY